MEMARKYVPLAMSVGADLIKYIIEAIRQRFKSVEIIVAPYEADSQLAYLSKINYVDLILTEDSDLLVFGAKEIMYKMDNKYQGIVYKLKELQYCEEMNLLNMSHSRFI